MLGGNMALKTRANLTDDCELLLDDSGNTIWAAATIIDPAVTRALREASQYAPQHTLRWMTARHYSKDIDLSSLQDLIDVRYASYPVILKDTDGDLIDDGDIDHNRHKIHWDDVTTARLKIANAPCAEATDQLTGTVTFTAASTAITGSGTAFTTELRVGHYIRKNDEWYRVTAIASDTALTLGRNVVTADNGADTSGGTDYWDSTVLIACEEEHYLTAQTDLAGAMNAATADGVWSIVVKALGSGTIDRNSLLTIAGCDGTYRVAADATITTNVATLLIEPKLKDRVPVDAVVTIRPSSLYPKLERIVAELAAADVAINHASTAFDQIALVLTDISNAATELALANPEVDQGLADVDSGRAFANTVPTGGGLNDYLTLAQLDHQGAQGYLSTTAANLNQGKMRFNHANFVMSLRGLGLERRNKAFAELSRMRVPRTNKMYSEY